MMMIKGRRKSELYNTVLKFSFAGIKCGKKNHLNKNGRQSMNKKNKSVVVLSFTIVQIFLHIMCCGYRVSLNRILQTYVF